MRVCGTNQLMGKHIEGNFDGHSHVFDVGLPMVSQRRYTPVNNALPDDYFRLLQANNLQGALLVQPSFLGSDNSYLLAAIHQGNAIAGLQFRGVVVLEPDVTIDNLNRLSEAGIVGMRFNLLGTMTGEPEFNVQPWEHVLEFARHNNWHIELHCEGYHLPALLKIFSRRGLRIVIDHYGLPDPSLALTCPGQAAIANAPAGEVFVKISAPYRVFSGLDSATAAARCEPIFKQLVDCLGPEQLVWGSDWPWTQHERHHRFTDCLGWAGGPAAG